MKKIIPLILLLTSCKLSDSDILFKTKDKLNSFQTIKYDEYLTLGASRVDTISVFFDFTRADSLPNIKYWFTYPGSEQVYDGNESFFIDHEQKMVRYETNPIIPRLYYKLGFLLSIYQIKQLFSVYNNDPTIIFNRQNDTIIHHENCYLFNVLMPDNQYTIGISKNDFIPRYFKSMTPQQTNTTTFVNFEFDKHPSDSTWIIDTFSENYTWVSEEDFLQKIFQILYPL